MYEHSNICWLTDLKTMGAAAAVMRRVMREKIGRRSLHPLRTLPQEQLSP